MVCQLQENVSMQRQPEPLKILTVVREVVRQASATYCSGTVNDGQIRVSLLTLVRPKRQPLEVQGAAVGIQLILPEYMLRLLLSENRRRLDVVERPAGREEVNAV